MPPNPYLVDSHCHLDASEFDADRAAVIQRACAQGVTRQILPAVTAASWPKLRDVCSAYPGLYPAYGLHPVFLAEHRTAHISDLQSWVARERPLAIGECGLDFFVDGLDADEQQRYFDAQLKLARDADLPLVIHARRAVDAVLAAVRRIGGVRGVVHSFSGSPQQAQQLWNLGFSLGLGGPVTYPRAARLRRIVRDMPLDYLLLETDAPDQPGMQHRGERNEPAHLNEVLRTIAQLRDVSEAHVAAITSRNAERLFALPPVRNDAAIINC